MATGTTAIAYRDASTSTTKNYTFDEALTETASGSIRDVYFNSATDTDFAANTIIFREVVNYRIGTSGSEAGKLLMDLAIYKWDGSETYVNSTTPANSTGTIALSTTTVVGSVADSFLEAAGVDRTA